MRSIILSFLTLTGCVGDSNPATDSGVDASVEASSDATQETSTTDASDAPTGDGYVPFCQAQGAGALFCADFEAALNVQDNWDAVTQTAGTATLDNAVNIAGSLRSAHFAMTTASSSQVTLVKALHTGSLKSKVTVDYDAYFTIPSWTTTDGDEFLTIVLSTTSVSSQYYVDLERGGTSWQATHTTGAANTFSAVSLGMWHHFTMSYDGTAAPPTFKLMIDTNSAVSTTLLNAPASFDTISLNPDAECVGTTTPATEVRYDNIVVRVQ